MAVAVRLVEGKAALMQSKTVGERWLVTGTRRRRQRWWWMDGAAVGVIFNGDDGVREPWRRSSERSLFGFGN